MDVRELEKAAARLKQEATAPRREQRYYDKDHAEEEQEAPGAIPPGYRMMVEAERLETLDGLKQKLIELDQRYARLPLRIETEGQRRQQQHLREKIAETEDAVKLLSRPDVLIEA